MKARLQMDAISHNQKEYPAVAIGLESVKKTHQVVELGKVPLPCFRRLGFSRSRRGSTRICH